MFDRDLAVQLGYACQYAYASSAFLSQKLSIPPGQNPFGCCDDNTPPTSFAIILSYPTMRIVAFQGTITRKPIDMPKWNFDAALDWLQNFRIELIGSDKLSFHVPGRIHQGFASQLDLIYNKITGELRNGPPTPIFVTGHSQGGAIAGIATKALVTDGFPVSAAYTFAAPRPGDSAFANSVTTEVHRLEYGDDIVPHVPMRTALPILFRLAIDKAMSAGGQAADLLKKLAELADSSYQAVGTLTYANSEIGPHFDLARSEEDDLANHRRMHLLFAGKKLVEHHHLYNYLGGILGVQSADLQGM